ncbi:arylamine N-acetyltransferase family protein [Metabacillus iocasae]|uniref:N-hydroxyarylamine O-acetyltransferase n=1 Tax=Priestia iocasae TaxID=2291674 RepID=A0ABS2QTA4_9BACI|nr:arylamine N-acetyltransferase [Metabacillus iocasae]MBM7702518.1 N-hydroxyarylamine O-acetyltransferase [Metabacillus iocasae]
MNKSHYLHRIGVSYVSNPTLDYLTYLQEQHMLHIPFENLDVIKKVPIVLNVDHFYEKVVNHLRGGFCYELNGLFHWLLAELDYDVKLLASTVQRDDGSWALDESHATNMVTIKGIPYLVDVGFGDSIRKPVPFTGEFVTDVSGSYRLTYIEDGIYDFQKKLETEWKTKYRVSVKAKQLQEFKTMCEFNQTSPHSPFTKALLATIATKDGRITLSGSTLTITTKSQKQKYEVKEHEVHTLLHKHFHIQLS